MKAIMQRYGSFPVTSRAEMNSNSIIWDGDIGMRGGECCQKVPRPRCIWRKYMKLGLHFAISY